MGSSAVGSCIRCCRFSCAPGEGTLGIPAHYPRKHRWAGGPQLCCPRCATFTVAWQAGWGCIRASRPRLPWSCAAQAFGLGPLITGAATLASSLLAWVEGFPPLCGFLRPPVSFLSRLGFVHFFPLPVERISALLGFGGLCLSAVLSPSCCFSALARSCCSRAVQRTSWQFFNSRQVEKLIPLNS